MYPREGLLVSTAALLLVIVPRPTAADNAMRERVPITDPDMLERLGFEPDAANVYATPRAYEELEKGSAEPATAQRVFLEAAPTIEPASPFGSATGYSPVMYTEFLPNFSGDLGAYGEIGAERFCDFGTKLYRAQVRTLPHGAQFHGVRFWLFDEDGVQNIQTVVYRICQPDALGGSPEVTVLGVDETGNPSFGNTLTVIDVEDETVDLQSCTFLLSVRLGDNAPTLCGDTNRLVRRIQKAVAYWSRQVSPAPTTPTFDDVPAEHLFFRHIEALAASGITAGCDVDSFCPGSPVTRGQMAVFLAKALGLHWGSF